MNADKKRCPYCSEEILIDAKKCRFCGEFLDGTQRSKSEPPVVVAKEGCFLQSLNIGCAVTVGIILLIIIIVIFLNISK